MIRCCGAVRRETNRKKHRGMWVHGILIKELEDGQEDINEFQRLHHVFIFVVRACQSCDPLRTFFVYPQSLNRCRASELQLGDFGSVLVFCVCVLRGVFWQRLGLASLVGWSSCLSPTCSPSTNSFS